MATFADETDGASISNDISNTLALAIYQGTYNFQSSSQVTITFNLSGQASQLVLKGMGLGLDQNNQFTLGTISEFDLTIGGVHAYDLSGFNVTAAVFHSAANVGTAMFDPLYAGNDTFNLTHASAGASPYSLYGGAGDDVFNFGAKFNPNDTVDGGTGHNKITLNGDYGAGALIIDHNADKNIEKIELGAGHNYFIGLNASFNQALTLDGSALGSGNTLTASTGLGTFGFFTELGGAGDDALTGGDYDDTLTGNAGNDSLNGGQGNDTVTGGIGNDTLVGGRGNDSLSGGDNDDTLDLTDGGHDTADGGDGDDLIEVGDAFNATFGVDGGPGTDTLLFTGFFGSDVFTLNDSVLNVEKITLSVSGNMSIVSSDLTVAAGKVLTVDASTDAYSFGFDGSAETDGTFILKGGSGSDTFTLNTANLLGGDTVDGGGNSFSGDKLVLTTAGTLSAALMAHISHIEQFVLANGANSVTLTDAVAASSDNSHVLAITGNAGADTVDASALSLANGIDFSGAAGADRVLFSVNGLTGNDTVDGGNDTAVDTLALTTAGTLVSNAFSHVSHIEQITLANGTNTVTLTNSLVGTSDDGHILHVSGGSGNDTIDAGNVFNTSYRVYMTAGSGNDTLIGGAGLDIFYFAAADLTAADSVNGGTGSAIVDLLVFTTAGTIGSGAFQNVSHIEQIVLANGVNAVTLTDAVVGSADDSHVLSINGSAGNDTVDGSLVVTAANRIFVTAGSGSDTLKGGAGSDTFYFTVADLSAADTVNGGAGASADRITFTSAGTIAAGAFQNVSHIEQLLLANGTNAVTLTDAVVGASDPHILTVVGGTGDDVINASAVTTATNRVYFTSGSGNDTLTGGSGLDLFYFAAADFNASDVVNGGAGSQNDVIAFTTAGSVASAAFQNVSHVEQLVLAAGTNNLTLSNALVGSSDVTHLLVVSGSSGNDTIDASAVLAPNLVYLVAGAGNDTLIGGSGADRFFFSAADFNASDSVNGNGGASDTIQFTTAGTVTAAAFANVSHVEQIALANGNNNIALSNAMVGGSDASHLVAVTGGTGNDTIDAGAVTTAANRVFFSGGAGADTLTAGAGADTFLYAAAGDSTSTGYDTIAAMNFATDHFDTPGALGTITVDGIRAGQLDSFSLDTELAARFSTLAGHHAGILSVTSGNLSGQTFLVVDLNGAAGYQTDADLVIHLTSSTGTLTSANFF